MDNLTFKTPNGATYIDNTWKSKEYDKHFKISTGECIDKLGKFELLFTNADSIRIIKRNGIYSLHIDMILDSETLPIAESLFDKDIELVGGNNGE